MIRRDDPQAQPSKTDQGGSDLTALEKLGWQDFFADQVVGVDLEETPPARVVEAHRSGLRVQGDGIDELVPPKLAATVGDWILLNRVLPTSSRVLERKSLFKRRAPGHDRSLQLIAANTDTSFIVSSCNPDFNLARLERYLALAFEAGVAPVVLLTKLDLCEDPTPYVEQAEAISDRVPVVLLNAKSDSAKAQLAPWCKPGETLVFLGSSGVGKSTLVNALFGKDTAETAEIREDDARGRHTTRHRHMRFLPNGCAVMDTPGMRELQMAEAESGIADLFDDLTELATQCKFRNCKHESEPGCALTAALARGEITQARFERWNKLTEEERYNTASLSERKGSDKVQHKTSRPAQKRYRKTRR
ncbi:ribosome small subunit-dependent GTPase A [Phaeobacter sp. 11ANDIMAR09]|uniref:ribosome small subunit-dependent GTPase A n=1 Tax=Phaeobacter sp. 11ANDIMAR09 TaxID=1225647 RepID=UPI0006C8D558|nr:ribosome small subunit-dependent GTPase A [Phaeobacter sp. 11ANDIMAR09]KPD13316.1 GTP-binding protein EngC [Phaeobacter sp. 11ANDIMAR09]